MSSANGPDGPIDCISRQSHNVLRSTLECKLLESLIHHLIEKGVLTRNDALSVVQTVAEVKRGALEEQGLEAVSVDNEVATLKRLYASFALMDPPTTSPSHEGENVHHLRPPLHDGRPEFPTDE